jgi:hypothetical protein
MPLGSGALAAALHRATPQPCFGDAGIAAGRTLQQCAADGQRWWRVGLQASVAVVGCFAYPLFMYEVRYLFVSGRVGVIRC